ncbi:hypothetical protein FACS1894188_02720 [Clostridia bacterium]|nr:hypothetical protein FACS1894188_02720 [Clostridia bacterium]
MLKRIFSAVLSVFVALSAFSSVAFAETTSDLNKGYWQLQPKFNAAKTNGDDAAIITTGSEIIKLFTGLSPGGNEADFTKKAAELKAAGKNLTIDITYGALNDVANAYEDSGKLNEAAVAFKNLLPLAYVYREVMPSVNPAFVQSDFDFTISIIKNKIAYLDIQAAVYVETKTDGGVFYGAKFEPKSGIYYGQAFNGDHNSVKNTKAENAAKKSSGQLIYVQFENEKIESYDWLFQKSKANHSVIEVAWNLKNEGSSLKDVLNQRSKIESAVKYLNTLNTPILLRFGAEMNVWENKANPEDFIKAFQFVADIAHKNASNVAMVWSPNSIGHKDSTYEEFYPGDSYVDWVGISLYTMYYFKGDKNQDENTQQLYMTGKYANPIQLAEPIILAFGDRKPIMFAEGGVENYSVTNKEDLSDWAVYQLDILYGYAPVIYPQVKAMFYFDKFIDGEKNRFSLYDNDKLNTKYLELVNNPYFLEKGKTSAGISYKKAGAEEIKVPAASVPLITYAPYFTKKNVSVTYRVDNNWVGASSELPYRQNFDFSGLSDGEHTLEAVVQSGEDVLFTSSLKIIKSGATIEIK